jgi:hypothetical protein
MPSFHLPDHKFLLGYGKQEKLVFFGCLFVYSDQTNTIQRHIYERCEHKNEPHMMRLLPNSPGMVSMVPLKQTRELLSNAISTKSSRPQTGNCHQIFSASQTISIIGWAASYIDYYIDYMQM